MTTLPSRQIPAGMRVGEPGSTWNYTETGLDLGAAEELHGNALVGARDQVRREARVAQQLPASRDVAKVVVHFHHDPPGLGEDSRIVLHELQLRALDVAFEQIDLVHR